MKKFALAAVVLVALAFPAIAAAKKISVSGGVVKDPDSSIKAKVTVKNGDVKKISDFKASGIDIRCNGQTFENFGFNVTGSIPVNARNSFRVRLPNNEDPTEKLRVSGKVKKKGKRVSGNIKTNKLTINNETCDMPKQHFELKK
jgi:opacity protein-like surface antigen